MRIISVLALVVIGVCACSTSDDAKPPAGNGRLVRWSGQTLSSPKKIVLIPGHVMTDDPHGLSPRGLESYYSPKLENLDYLGEELFGARTSEVAEFWLYGYQSQQDVAKIAGDLALAIKSNENFDNSAVAIVGHSEGGSVAWILDQRHDVMVGGVLLGACIDSTPLVHKDKRDAAISSVFPLAGRFLIQICDDATWGSSQLEVSYREAGTPRTRLKFFAGHIQPHSKSFIQRNIDLLDEIVEGGGNFLTGLRDGRQLFELGAVVIDSADWGSGSERDRMSDGVVPVSSATAGLDGDSVSIWDDYDHMDLMNGKGELSLDRETLEWLDEILDLAPKWVDTDLPQTPEVIELPQTSANATDWAKFAYVKQGKLCVVDSSWAEELALPLVGEHNSPSAGAPGQLAWSWARDGRSDVCIWDRGEVRLISFDGKSKFPSFSPNKQWLSYQSSSNLLIHHLGTDQRSIVIEGVDLVAAPIWTVEGLRGKLYFAAVDRRGQQNLYAISPRARQVQLKDAELVLAGCSDPILVRGPISGIVAISTDQNSATQRLVGVSGNLAKHLSVEFRSSPEYAMWNEGSRLIVALPQPFRFERAVFDWEYWHLYVVGETAETSGIFLLDMQAFLSATDITEWDDIFYLVRENACELEIIAPTQ